MLKRTRSDAGLDGNANGEGEARDECAFSRFEMVKRTYSKAYHHGGKHYDNNSANDNARVHYGDVYRYHLEAPNPETPAQKMSRIQEWLGGTRSHSRKHAMAVSETGDKLPTGQWLLDSRLYKSWQNEPNSWVWYYGIPGCGKTVLNATAVQNLREQYADRIDYATIQFYFDFNNSRRNDLNFMLRSLIGQLVEKGDGVPEEMDDMYTHTCLNGTREPTDDQLMETFRRSLMRFTSVFIALDALDEAESDADQIHDALRTIHKWDIPCLHTFITSRRESSIYECLESIVLPGHRLEILPKTVNRDIKIWLDEQLCNGRLGKRLEKWDEPDFFKSKIRNGLMDRASGMFLLTKLQLDELERCSSEAEVDQALREMPRTLKETFDRIVARIDDRNRQSAEIILRWLAYAFCPLCVEDVQWTVAFTENQQSEIILDPRKRMQNGREEIFAKCSSLVRLVKEADTEGDSLDDGSTYYVELAHSTIKEYLVSEDRTVKSTTWLGVLRPSVCHDNIARYLLAYLLHFELYGMLLPGATESSRYDSLAIYARLFWRDHASSSEIDPTSSPLHAQLQRIIDNKTIMESCASTFQLDISDTHLPHTVQAMQDAWKSLLDHSFRLVPEDMNKLKRSLTQELCTVDLSGREAGPWKRIEYSDRLDHFLGSQLSQGPWSEFSVCEKDLTTAPLPPNQPPSPPSNPS